MSPPRPYLLLRCCLQTRTGRSSYYEQVHAEATCGWQRLAEQTGQEAGSENWQKPQPRTTETQGMRYGAREQLVCSEARTGRYAKARGLTCEARVFIQIAGR